MGSMDSACKTGSFENCRKEIDVKRNSKMKPLKTKVSITLDSEIIDKIKALAEEDDRSFSQYINLVLKEYLKERTKNKAK